MSRLLFAGLFLSLSLISRIDLHAQEATGQTSEALRRVFEKGNLLVAISDVNWKKGLNMVGGTLQPGKVTELVVSLEAGHSYKFVGSTENEDAILDLQLIYRDSILASDENDDATPILAYTAENAGQYVVKLYLRAADESRLGVAIGILEDSGATLTSENFRDVRRRFFSSSHKILTAASDFNWATTGGAWSVFGFLSAAERPIQLENVYLERAEYLFAISGNPKIPRIRIYLANHQGKIVVTKDENSAFPLISYSNRSVGNHILRIEPATGRRSNFILLGLFQK